MIYTDSKHVSKTVLEVLADIDGHAGASVFAMLESTVKLLNARTSGGSKHNPIDLDDDESGDDPIALSNQSDDEAGFYGASDSDDDAWSFKSKRNATPATRYKTMSSPELVALNERIRADLTIAKAAGFRLSCHHALLDGGKGGIVSLSIRLAKLGLSSEALQAWSLDASHYFAILIRYVDGYVSFKDLLQMEIGRASSSIQIRVGIQQRYRISTQEATDSFHGKDTPVDELPKDKKKSNKAKKTSKLASGLNGLFIGRQLEELLNTQLPAILRVRQGRNFSWRGAEDFVHDHQGSIPDQLNLDPKYLAKDPLTSLDTFPRLVTDDHLTTPGNSFPLVAMQFALRHLVHCTSFCLVCHCYIEVDFEALKPYVCSRPLCLYQYSELQTGSSIPTV